METFTRYRGYAILGLVFAVFVGGYVLWERWPQPEPLTIVAPTPTATVAPSPTPAPLRVHVTGAVQQPGVYILPPDSRLIDAVEAAGGLAANADSARINLAGFVYDGQQVFVPYALTPAPPSPTALPTPSVVGQPSVAGGGPININTASAAELDTLPGIGPAYAERIIAYREEHGPFADPIEIMEVKGIGPATYEEIKNRITAD